MPITIGPGFSAGPGFAASSVATDPYFNQVSLLLHGNGVNAAQNNTFIDSSVNNLTVTRTGAVTQGTLSQFSQPDGRWSNYFNGSSRFQMGTTSSFRFAGNFTVEAWVYRIGTTQQFVAGYWTAGVATQCSWAFGHNNGFAYFAWGIGATNLAIQGTTQPIPLNQWTHIAAVRSGTTVTMYVNGRADATTGTASGTLNTPAASLYIGALNPTDGLGWFGFISNLRIVNGTAVYTANFTPSTQPLTAIANTGLLTCQSYYFKDNSTNNFSATAVTGAATQTQSFGPFTDNSPFTGPAAYSTSVNGGSAYFTGTGNYLSAPLDSINIRTTAFTVEGWCALATATNFIFFCASSSASPGISLYLQEYSGAVLLGDGVANNISFSPSLLPLNQWFHCAVTFDGTTYRVFINGTLVGSSTTLLSNIVLLSTQVGARTAVAPVGAAIGYISNFRVVKGTAVYTANFAPPTAPLTAISGTSLLLSGTNTGVLDNAIKNNLVTAGNAQVSTAVVKYGTGSIQFNGTTAYLTAQVNAIYAFGSGDWTIEMWLYASALPTNPASAQLYDTRPASTNGAYPLIYLNSNGRLYLYVSSADRITGSVISTGQWYHVAVSRSAGSTRMFINGTQTGSTYTDSTVYLASDLFVGASYSGGPSIRNYFNGYIDELRVTNGVARYTTTFTPPDAAFPDR